MIGPTLYRVKNDTAFNWGTQKATLMLGLHYFLPRTLKRRSHCVRLLGCAVFALTFGVAPLHGEDLSRASSSRASKQAAKSVIPLNKMNQDAQNKILSVLNNTSIYRRLPVSTYHCDSDLHNFLIRYPEVVVGIWKVMGITQVDAARIKDYTVKASDGAGTDSTIELLYGTKNLHVFYGQGTYKGPLFNNQLTGSCVLVLQSGFGQTKDGSPIVTDRLDVFIRVDNIGVKILAKTLHSLVGKTADVNFSETSKFIGKISETSETNGPGVQRLGARVDNLNPEVLKAFQRLALVVNDRAAARLQAQLSQSRPQTDYRSQLRLQSPPEAQGINSPSQQGRESSPR